MVATFDTHEHCRNKMTGPRLKKKKKKNEPEWNWLKCGTITDPNPEKET